MSYIAPIYKKVSELGEKHKTGEKPSKFDFLNMLNLIILKYFVAIILGTYPKSL